MASGTSNTGGATPSSSAQGSPSNPSSSSAAGPTTSTSNNATSSGPASTSSSNSRFSNTKARFARFQQTRPYKGFKYVRTHRRGFLVGASLVYLGYSYTSAAIYARKRDRIHDSTYLYFNVYDGAIVESKSSANVLSNLIFSSGGGGSDEPARVMTIFDVVRTLNWAMRDDRIKGIIADFSSLSSPSVQSPYSLGLAQIEEVCDALEELNRFKAERLGAENWRSIAFTDTFDSQGQYTLASAFNEIYLQPTGEVPLTGLGSQIPFFRRLIDWLGITVQAEAREKYKSFIAQYTEEKLTEPQTANQYEVLNSLNDLMLERIARNRFGHEFVPSFLPSTALPIEGQALSDTPVLASPLEEGESGISKLDSSEDKEIPQTEITAPDATDAIVNAPSSKLEPLLPAEPSPQVNAALSKLRKLSFEGPFSAREAVDNGLVTGMSYKSYVLDSVLEPEYGGKEEHKLMGFYHYYKVMDKAVARSKEPVLDVGVVYLMGTIGEAGEYDAGSVVKGLRQAGEDEEIGCVVLRIDSGGGGVVDSDSIDQAVRDLTEKKGKVVIASFSNSAASGGYLSACHADAIMAHPSTLTGSIGVAALRPAFTPTFLDKIKLTVQSIMTGSDYSDLTKELTGPNLAKYKKHVDETYQDFKDRVIEGREIHPDLINDLAGGRVYTGQMAFNLLSEVNKARQPAQDLPGTVRLPHVGEASKADEKEGTVQLAEGQEMSPFAPPEDVSGAPPEDVSGASEGAVTQVADEGLVYPDLGPLGRGIVDGLGGIRDAAALAAEVFLTRALAEVKAEQPDISDAQAIEKVLPGMKYELTEDQKVILPIDVNLKQFPVEKSFWQLYKEASSKGDAMSDPAGTAVNLPHMLKMAFTSWIFTTASKVLSEEMDSMGLADVRRGMGLGGKSRGRAYMRAEAPRWSTS